MSKIFATAIHNTLPDLADVIQEHLPYSWNTLAKNNLAESIYLWLDSYDGGQAEGSFIGAIGVREDYSKALRTAFTSLGVVMDAHLYNMFQENTDEEMVKKFPNSSVNRQKYLNFMAFARASVVRGARCMSGRYDFVINPEDGEVFIYEYNPGTAACLFESTVLQSELNIRNNTPSAGDWRGYVDFLRKYEGKNVAIVVDDQFAEDLGTSETIATTMRGLGVNPIYVKESEFLFNEGHVYDEDNPYSPFYSTEDPSVKFAAVYAMIPWEHLMMSDFMDKWQEWCTEVDFLVPAHQWLMSHKSFLTYLTEDVVKAIMPDFNAGEAKIKICSRSTPELFFDRKYVRKPVLGRQSASVSIFEGGLEVTKSEHQELDNGDYVYQPFVEPPLLGGQRVIGTMFMSDHYACGLGFRGFHGDILQVDDEVVIPYVLVP